MRWWLSLWFLPLFIVSVVLVSQGSYGLTLFVVLPILTGLIGAAATNAQTLGKATENGGWAAGLALLGFLAAGLEGLICTIMCIPLAMPLGWIGGALWFAMAKRRSREGSAAMLLLPLATFGWDVTATPDVYEVRSAIEIAATPEQVWQHVVTFADLPEPTEWYFQTGIAYPKRARIEGSGVGAVRYCEFSTGPFVEPIETWDEPRLLQFRVTENPAPMHEWSPYANVTPKHLHGYMVSKRGQFKLTALPDGRTLLEGTTWYQHGLWPGFYWRLWSDAIIHRIHLRVLTHIKGLAEA